MRRAVLALGSTVAGLILLLSFRTHTASTAAAGETASGSGSASSGSSSGSVSGSATPTPAASKTAAAGTGTTGGTGAAGGTAAGSKTVTGDVINGPYGPSQVAITLTGSKITKVTILQHTDDGVTSEGIDGPALPKLTAETLTAQSAKIDAVSGATYTSAGYIKSLQSAIDKAMT